MVSFVGAGPGDPDLITVKGRKCIEKADVLIYAGSLVNKKHLAYVKDGCQIYNSAHMHLEEVLDVIMKAEEQHQYTVRLHTGDPSIYGAIKEQMDALSNYGIAFEVIPGVSSFCGAAASLKVEYTLPGQTQTVILTRMAGRTAVPEEESIESLSSHKATMILFLSVDKIGELTQRLMTGYDKDTPAAVVYKATWEEEMIVRGTLKDIAQKTEKAGITKTALVIIGPGLGEDYELSKLYDKHFETGFRKAVDSEKY